MTEDKPRLLLRGRPPFVQAWQGALESRYRCLAQPGSAVGDEPLVAVVCECSAAPTATLESLLPGELVGRLPVLLVGDGDPSALSLWPGERPEGVCWLPSHASAAQLLFALHGLLAQTAAQRRLHEDLQRFRQVQEMALLLNSQRSFDELFETIIHQVSCLMAVDRTSLFLLDVSRQQLWTKVAEGLNKQISIPVGVGLSGKCAAQRQPVVVQDAGNHPDFDASWDEKLNYVTRTALCYPVFNRSGELKGVLQMINKKEGLFSSRDQELAEVCAAQVGVALENFELIEELAQGFESFIRTLTELIDAKHKLTAGHSHRVTEYALLLGARLGLDERMLDVLKYSALLHDIGKIAIPDRVLTKNGRLTAEELEVMQSHPLWTGRILKRMRLPRHLSQLPRIASSHHERIDGSGYPHGAANGEIPRLARLLAVADVFDALSSRRDYPKRIEGDAETTSCEALQLERVFEVLQHCAGDQLDPSLVALAVEQRSALEQLWQRLHSAAGGSEEVSSDD